MLASSTPDALWRAAPVRRLQPSALSCVDLHHRDLLHGCTLSVPVGTRLLVVGEPEASASALVRMLAGLIPVRRGRIEIAGLTDPSADGWGRRVAYVGPDPGIPGWMTPREALGLAADLLDLPGGIRERRTDRVVAWTRIPADLMDRAVRHGGPPLLQRTGLAAALLADPEVLLLDEPLRALDQRERRSLLRVPGRRRTVVLASRYAASEEGIVTVAVLLRQGRVALRAPLSDLEAAGLPLSMRGIETLAALRAAAPT